MSNIYRIRAIDGKKTILRINPTTANVLGIGSRKIITLSFGNIRLFADVNESREVPEREIRLSNELMTNLHLPDYLEFEINVKRNEMIIGPYIGMLMRRENKRLTASFLERMKIYVKAYKELHGAVVIFALDKVDVAHKLIEGYCYNPISRNFEKGIYPFPSSMYRAIGLSNYWKNYFLSVLGDRFFNNNYFNKLEMYRWFSDYPSSGIRIPFTSVYKTAKDVFDLLDRFGKVYIKPVLGLGGRGIVRVQHENGVYVFNYRENGVNLSDELQSRDQATEYMRDKFAHGKYLIQQAIELIKYRGGVVDFRCIMQKDQSREWVCKAIIGRCGEQGSIVSNISNGGRAFKIEKMKEKSMPLSAEKILHLDDEIRSLALQICRILDELGLNCGTLGLDIGVDVEGNLWLIEINNRDPNPSIALNVHDFKLYEELKTGLLFYAKSLAGFDKVKDGRHRTEHS
jgi:glutathione synthase/RimK-type ligase-like ATP-grasp enzyme